MNKRNIIVLLVIFLMTIALTAVAGAAPTNTGVYWWWDSEADGDAPAGSATINRRDNGISGTVNTTLANDGTGDYEGTAVTLWIVVFNVPGECSEGCDGADLENPDVEADVLYGGGHIIGNSEVASFGVNAKTGDTAGSAFGNGLKYPHTAEVHYVVRSHGPKVPGQVNAMIQTFEGGCNPDPESPYNFPFGWDPPVDEGNLHTELADCQDIQYAIHQVE